MTGPERDPGTICAFFDMDRTLLTRSSSLLWIRYMWQKKLLSQADLVRYGWVLLRYRLRRLDIPALTRQLVGDLAGEEEADRVVFSRQWFDEQLIHYVAPEGRRAVERHRAEGHRLALITASPNYTADPLAAHLEIGLHSVLATRFEVEGGRFTGRLVEPMCFGQGKRLYAERYAAQHAVDLDASYFYTDSIDDLPLLERVGHPVAVNPDTALGKLAQRRGWPMVLFY